MAYDPILGIPQVTDTQNNKTVTINDAVAFLAEAGNKKYTYSTADATDIVIAEGTSTRRVYFDVQNATGAKAIKFPSTVQGQPTERLFAVKNSSTTYALTVRAAGTGVTQSLAAGQAGVFYQYADDVYLITLYDVDAGGAPYDVGFFVPGAPADNDDVLVFTFARAVTFADDFAGSVGHCLTNPTATAAFSVKKNGSVIGSASISTGGVFTFATTGGAAAFAIGDYLTLVAPTPADATLADVSITFKGTRN